MPINYRTDGKKVQIGTILVYRGNNIAWLSYGEKCTVTEITNGSTIIVYSRKKGEDGGFMLSDFDFPPPTITDTLYNLFHVHGINIPFTVRDPNDGCLMEVIDYDGKFKMINLGSSGEVMAIYMAGRGTKFEYLPGE